MKKNKIVVILGILSLGLMVELPDDLIAQKPFLRPRVSPKPVLPHNIQIADIDGDGFDDFVQFAANRIFVMRINAYKDGILHKYLDRNIRRLILGDFTKSGREHGRAQVCVVLDNNSFQCYSSSDDNRDLWRWFTQPNFIEDGEEPIVADFDGDGADDILLYDQKAGRIRMFTRTDGNIAFVPMPRFSLGNLASIDLKRKQLLAGEFGQAQGRADLLVVNPYNRRVSRYDSVTDQNGNKTFWMAFHSNTGVINLGASVSVANIDASAKDEIVFALRGPGTYRFFKAEFGGGRLVPVTEIARGNLDKFTDVIPIFGRFAAFDNEPGANRDDLLLFKPSSQEVIQLDARYDANIRKFTYWRAYTAPRPRLNEGWPARRTDRWLILKCQYQDVTDVPYTEDYCSKAFTEKGVGRLGMYDYMKEMSYGTILIKGEVPSGWKPIGLTHQQAINKVPDDEGNLVREHPRLDLGERAVRAWGYSDLSPYRGIVVIFNKGDIDYGNHGKYVVLHPDHFDQNLHAHEMLHASDRLWDSYNDRVPPEAYKDPYGIMGGKPEIRFSGNFGDSGPGLCGYNRHRMGLIPRSRVRTLRAGSPQKKETIRLAALDRPESNGYLLLMLETRSGLKYTVELRENYGWDRALPNMCVQVRRITPHPKYYDTRIVTRLQVTGDGPEYLTGEKFEISFLKAEVKRIDPNIGIAELEVTY